MLKKLLIVLLVAALSISAAQAGNGRAHGKDHGKGNPHMIICQIFSVFDWRHCRGDWT